MLKTSSKHAGRLLGKCQRPGHNLHKEKGLTVDGNPIANQTIAVFAPGSAGADPTYGHVAVVIGVSRDTVTIKEMNGPAGLGKTNTKSCP